MAERNQQDAGLQWIISQVEKPGQGEWGEGRFGICLGHTQVCNACKISIWIHASRIQKIPGPYKYMWNLLAWNENLMR